MKEERSLLQKGLLVLLAAMMIVSGVYMYLNRGQIWLEFRGESLKHNWVEELEQSVYSGKCKGRDVTVTVNRTKQGDRVKIDAGTDWYREYFVEFLPDEFVMELDGRPMLDVELYSIRITDGAGNLVFQGGYSPVNHMTVDKNGNWDVGVSIEAGGSGRDAWTDYEPSPVQLILSENTYTRGDWGLYFMMVLLTLVAMVDVAFPKALFYLEHMFTVRDPEPTEFYFVMQTLGWFVLTAFAAAGYWFAATAPV